MDEVNKPMKKVIDKRDEEESADKMEWRELGVQADPETVTTRPPVM